VPAPAPPVISTEYLHPSLTAVGPGGLPLVFGMTMRSGLFEMVLSGFLAEVHPDQRRSWVADERCHIQLVFEV
jgi:hypothetical protein